MPTTIGIHSFVNSSLVGECPLDNLVAFNAKPDAVATALAILALKLATPPEFQERLNKVADQMDLPASTIIRLAVKALVEAFEENESLPMPLKVKFITMEERIQHLEEKRKAS